MIREISKSAKAVNAAVVANTTLFYHLLCRAQQQVRLHQPFIRTVPNIGQHKD